MAVTAPCALDLASFISFSLCPWRLWAVCIILEVVIGCGDGLKRLWETVGLILSSLSRALSELLPLAQGCPGMCPPAAVPGVGPERWPWSTC